MLAKAFRNVSLAAALVMTWTSIGLAQDHPPVSVEQMRQDQARFLAAAAGDMAVGVFAVLGGGAAIGAGFSIGWTGVGIGLAAGGVVAGGYGFHRLSRGVRESATASRIGDLVTRLGIEGQDRVSYDEYMNVVRGAPTTAVSPVGAGSAPPDGVGVTR